MKEIRLQDLLNLADASAHDSIGDLWNQKAIHYLVVFTSPDQDFEIIGAGPTLPHASLEAAAALTIPNKQPEFFVKCPGAIAGRLQPRLAPSPVKPGTRPPNLPANVPSLKGRTMVPFARPALKLPDKVESPKPGTGKAETVSDLPATPPAAPPSAAVASPSPTAPHTTEPVKTVVAPSLEEREQAIARREHELTALAASLKIREASLRDREAAVAASEERLLNLPTKTN